MKAKPDVKEEDLFFEQLNAMTRQRNAEYEAQESACTDKAVARGRESRAVRKWRCGFNLFLCAVIMVALYCLYATEHISTLVTAYGISICLVCVGWHLNEAKRAFRRKG